VYVGHDYQPDGRDVRWRTTIEAERAGNIQLDASTAQADYVAFRRGRDATLSAPRLLWPSIQVNIDAGRLPPVDANGRRYVRIPLLLPASDQP
jgi:hypothetical protein